MRTLEQLGALYFREVSKIYQSYFTLIITFVQPLMWVVFFGSSLSNLPRQFLEQFFHTTNYLTYLLPGELAVSSVSMGMMASMSLVQDKRLGYMKRIMVSPTRKYVIFLAKVLGGATRGLIQVPVLLIVGYLMGAEVRLTVYLVLWVIALYLVSMGFSSIYFIFNATSADWQRPGLIMNLITFPLMFSSTALFPKTFFPWWLQVISDVNPITYLAELGRSAMASGGFDASLFVSLLGFSAVFLLLGAIVAEKLMTPE
ncbi:MAG: ABC transporter permease [Thermoprotei archaeon]